METAAGHLDAVLIAAGATARAELTRRRDQLARQIITRTEATYADALPAIQNAIDIIVDLQDKATK